MAKKKVFQISDALTEGLEETIHAAHHFSGELRVDVIPIKRIEVDPDNPRDFALNFNDLQSGLSELDNQFVRKTEELASLQTIAHSIRDQGIINPIVVYKHGQKYRLVAGERRTLASILAGKTDIQAKILEEKPSPLKISLLQWIENVERSDLNLWERLKNLEKIVEAYLTNKDQTIDQLKIAELSNLIGCTKPHAMNYKAVMLADENIKELIRMNKIKNLEKAALLANIVSPITKQNAIEACLMGASLKKLKHLSKESHLKILPLKTNKIKKRGRQALSVNFGATKNLQAAKVILNSIWNNESLSYLKIQFQEEVDWQDFQSISKAFKQLLQKIEELYA